VSHFEIHFLLNQTRLLADRIAMNKIVLSLANCVVGLMLSSSAFAQAPANTIYQTAETVPGEVIVRIKGNMNGSHAHALFNKLGNRIHIRHSLSSLNIHHLQIQDGSSAEEMINELNQSEHVVYAEPNYVLSMTSSTYGQDANYYQGTGYTKVSSQVSAVWNTPLVTQQNNIVVAVLDTGLDLTHQVFVSTSGIWVNSGETGTDTQGHNKSNNGIDDDNNGFIDDVHGWNFVAGSNSPSDDNGHGTHVSGIVLGVEQNILGSPLAASRVQIMPLKFMDSNGTGSTSGAVQAIDYAIANGARIINNSWGGSGYSQSLNDALTYAYNRGLFIASAAGNYSTSDDSGQSPLYPASLTIPSQLTVAASDINDNLSTYSSYGSSSVQVAAPGDSVESSYNTGGYAYLSGTSMATPFVSGVAALMLVESPQLTGYQVKQLIMSSVDSVSALSGKVSTAGRVNAKAAVMAANGSISTQSYQPVYSEQTPAGVSTGTQTTTGCGSVSTVLLSRSFWSRGGGSGGNSSQTLSLIACLLLMPLLAWFIVRSKLVSRQRRKHERFVMHSEVKVQVDGRELIGRLSTIGAGGVSFSADQMISKGGLVTMQIQSPGGEEQIQVVGRVVWNENTAHGVQFGPVGDSIVEKIRSWSKGLSKAA
jgi:subtilisin family serine protease